MTEFHFKQLPVSLPPIHAHSSMEDLNSHRSLAIPLPEAPPRSQKLPTLSVQIADDSRPEGVFAGDQVRIEPYVPALELDPFIHAHSPVEGENSHISFKCQAVASGSSPIPLKSQRLPLLSVQLDAL